MKAWTGIEIAEEHERLESESAKILGHLVFEYSRLEMEVGLVLAWTDEGRELERLTNEVGDFNLKKKLDRLEALVTAKYAVVASTESATPYAAWLAEANRLRALRNQFFHGRWGISPVKQEVFNVVGLPTSPAQREVGYSISDLQAVLESLRALRRQLMSLSKSWPV
jgi:hypothetical protein